MSLCMDVVVLGQLVDTKAGIFGTTTGLIDKFGPERVQDFPVSENLMTATAMGFPRRAPAGSLAHQRLDFAILARCHRQLAGAVEIQVPAGIPLCRSRFARLWARAGGRGRNTQKTSIPGLRICRESAWQFRQPRTMPRLLLEKNAA